MAKLEGYVATPNGGTAPRCQAKSKGTGEQCRQPARSGFSVCRVHGAGSAAREAAGTRKNAGRPVSHGLYSATAPRTLAELRAEVVALDGDLDNSDQEMQTVKAVLAYLFGRAEWLSQQNTMLEVAVDGVAQVLASAPVAAQGVPSEAELTVAQARVLGEQLAQGRRLLADISSFTAALIDANVKSINASKLRAETKAKRAEAEALATFARVTQQARNVLWQLAPSDQWLDDYEVLLRREVLGPLKVALPEDPAASPLEVVLE